MQTTDHVLMIRPVRFTANPETLGSNAFQHPGLDADSAQAAALIEFDAYVAALRQAGIIVMVVNDTIEPHTPDSIFPNNWITFHQDGKVLLYPMEAHNRRLERKAAILEHIGQHFQIRELIDLSHFEEASHFLEGTGSMVLDHDHKIAYVCHSSRSHPVVLAEFAVRTGYKPCCFHATDHQGKPIYHTNVMMCVGRRLAVVCMETITCTEERAMLAHSLQSTGKTIIEIIIEQMRSFAGNMLELQSTTGQAVFAMSQSAWNVLTDDQQEQITSHARIVLAPIDAIERLGGGSARCMLAEIFLPRQKEYRT